MRSKDQIERRIEKLLANPDLNVWSTSFCESLLDRLKRGYALSIRQFEKLTETEREYGPSFSEWKESWSDENWDTLQIIVDARARAGWYGLGCQNGLAINEDKLIDRTKSKIPTEREYKRIVENKYNKKILKNYQTPPLYPVGSMVCLRDLNGYNPVARQIRYSGANKRVVTDVKNADGSNRQAVVPYVVIENDGRKRLPSSTKGTRLYSLLAVGGTDLVDLEERAIKRYRPKKK